MANAFAARALLALGQVRVDGKSNEIAAIPALLELLDIAGSTVTADAMHTQGATKGERSTATSSSAKGSVRSVSSGRCARTGL